MTIPLTLPYLTLAGAESARDEGNLTRTLIAAANGDSGALARLYDAVAGELYGLALWRCRNHGLAEDAIQDVFCRLASGNVRLPASLSSPRAWLFASVRNAVIDLERRAARWSVLEDSAVELAHSKQRSEVSREEVIALSAALAELSPKMREAVYLHVYVGMTFREAGAVLGVPTFTAASRYRLALRRLEKSLGA